MLLEKTKIYGVDGVGGSSPTLARTDGAVGLSYTVGNSEITSDFNNCYPWSDMQEVVDSAGNVFVRIPKFYTKITKNENGTMKYQISGCRYDGFSTLFVDGKGYEVDFVYVGKYEASGSSERCYSKSGQTCLVSVSLAQMRTACRANGDGYQQYDFLIDAIIKQLFMIEFATTNSQSIMMGWVDGTNAAAIITGHTDMVKTPSGSFNTNHTAGCVTCNTDGHHAFKYRGIENLYGNVWKFCDGISFSGEKTYLCIDPTEYDSGKITAPYFYVCDRATSTGNVNVISLFDKYPLLGYTTSSSGDSFTYYCDYYGYLSGGSVLVVGGNWLSGSFAGLWFYEGSFGTSVSSSYIGGRLCYKPI